MECKAQALWHKVDSNCMSEEWHITFGLSELQQFAIPLWFRTTACSVTQRLHVHKQSLPQAARKLLCKTCESSILAFLTYAFEILPVVKFAGTFLIRGF